MQQTKMMGLSATSLLVQGVLLMALFLFSMSSHAAPAIDEPNDIDPHTGAMESLESMDGRLDDGSLADVHGKGVESNPLQSGQQLAVILWDERGNDPRNTTRNDESVGCNAQNVSLTVNRR